MGGPARQHAGQSNGRPEAAHPAAAQPVDGHPGTAHPAARPFRGRIEAGNAGQTGQNGAAAADNGTLLTNVQLLITAFRLRHNHHQQSLGPRSPMHSSTASLPLPSPPPLAGFFPTRPQRAQRYPNTIPQPGPRERTDSMGCVREEKNKKLECPPNAKMAARHRPANWFLGFSYIYYLFIFSMFLIPFYLVLFVFSLKILF